MKNCERCKTEIDRETYFRNYGLCEECDTLAMMDEISPIWHNGKEYAKPSNIREWNRHLESWGMNEIEALNAEFNDNELICPKCSGAMIRLGSHFEEDEAIYDELVCLECEYIIGRDAYERLQDKFENYDSETNPIPDTYHPVDQL